LELLNRFDKVEIADLRIAALDHRERFLVKLLRAAMVQDALVVIDRPFRLVPDLPDAEMIQDSLNRIDELYQSCQIFDYLWNRDRYRIDDVQESSIQGRAVYSDYFRAYCGGSGLCGL